jgi:hypothetical protein
MPLAASSIFVFFVKGDSFLSRAIRRITGGTWSHCGIGFTIPAGAMDPELRDHAGEEIYFEALFAKGFSGPRPLSDLYDWAAKDPERKVVVVRLGGGADFASEKLVIAQTWCGTVGYAEWQLVAMWFFERIGRRIGLHVPKSTRRVVCSEAVARILYPQIDLTDADHPRLDEVTPVSLYWALQKWLGRVHEHESTCRIKGRFSLWPSRPKPRTMNPEPGTVPA